MDLVDRLNAAEKALFDHCGYAHDWRVFPVVDGRDMYWRVDVNEREWCAHSPKREAFEAWDAEREQYPEKYGDCFYTSEIYTNRFLPKWVFRGKTFTLVLERPGSDGNIWLAVYRNDREVKRS